ncbi:MAG: permease [Deltaproteobacteria bacterium]|nr:permease [Deltaproteobacteria bacterium]
MKTILQILVCTIFLNLKETQARAVYVPGNTGEDGQDGEVTKEWTVPPGEIEREDLKKRLTILGLIIMILLVASGWRLFMGKEILQPSPVGSEGVVGLQPTWSGLLLSGSGWWEALKYIGNEFRFFWLNLAIGILLGGMILAAGLQKWWIDFSQIGGGGILSDILSAFVAPILGMILFVPPVGNLAVISNLFKTYTIGYPGVVSFVLVSMLNPLILSGYARLLGRRRAMVLVGLLFLSAFVSGLLVTALYALFGFRPGHVPLGRELVDEIIRWLPFTMGKMSGM